MTDAQQLWLPFDSLDGKEKQIDWSVLKHYENPNSDNECLLELQYQYRVNGKQDALAQIYELSVTICGKYISNETRRNRHIKHLSAEERQTKAIDAAAYILESYLKKEHWYIKKSFTGYLFKRVQHELYYQREVDKIVDFVDLNEFFKEGNEDGENESLY